MLKKDKSEKKEIYLIMLDEMFDITIIIINLNTFRLCKRV
jgi:hypothetical protein